MESIESLVSGLQSEIALLKAEIDLLRSQNTSLQALISSLTSANKRLSLDNAQLKEQLGLNAKNSSIPSSKELYKIKRQKVKSLRNRGGQPGHPGATRSKLYSGLKKLDKLL